MDIKVIILCGGEAERWNNYLGVKKHFVPVYGEPLLKNTILKLQMEGVDDITIAGRGNEYKIEGTEFLYIPRDSIIDSAQKLQSSRRIWACGKNTALIFGAISRFVWVAWFPFICLWHKMLCGRVTLVSG
ncbi:hypothetical protein BD293_2776 [Roseinatronobacter monicus]|uniref:MobA-like NTP transferase domain-containing protein n=1 Tax=Roseinatronobacter monicus TaxID=393481 RepID=A0A543KGC5_9RHOB|nr:hypothetical protein BD293_2776 [Roseinatronobacter monicus]